MLKKLLASLLLAIFLFVSMGPSFAKAQSAGQWYNQDFRQWYTKVYDENTSPPSEIFGERYTAAQVQWVIYGFWSFLVNQTSNADLVTCFMNKNPNPNDCIDAIRQMISLDGQETGVAQAPSKTNFLSAIFAERPMSGIGYVREKIRNFHIVPSAQAQQAGFGFGALSPIQSIWRGVRNVSYTLFVFAIIVIAFMIMFRVKISPQTVISVQSVLPKLIIAIILATFSYAISGFLIDLVYVAIGLFAIMMQQSGLVSSWQPAFNFMTGSGGGFFLYILAYSSLFLIGLLASLFVLLPTVILIPFFAAPLTLLSIIATIIVMIVLFFAAFKLFWMLFKAVANVYLLTIFAPLQISLGAILPSVGIWSWLRSLAANLAVFPLAGGLAYIAMFFVAYSIPLAVAGFINDPIIGDLYGFVANLFGLDLSVLPPGPSWSPPLIGLAGRGVALTFVITSLVILLVIPKLADIIKSMIEGKPFGYGSAIGEAMGGIAGYGLIGAEYAAARRLKNLQRGESRDVIYPVEQGVISLSQMLQKRLRR